MAYAERLPSGRYRGRYRDSAGVRHTLTNGGHGWTRKTDARHAAAEEETKARRRAPSSGPAAASITWGEWWDQIAEERSDRPSDAPAKEAALAEKHIRPRWGTVPLNRIQASDVRKWIRELGRYKTAQGKPLAPRSIRLIHAVFAMSINRAVADEVLNASPLVRIELPPVTHTPKAYATHESIAPLLEAMRGDYARAVEFLLETGLRPSELTGLHASTVGDDWLIVQHIAVPGQKAIRPWPKNRKARKVPLTSRAAEIIADALGRELNVGCGLPHVDGAECRSDLVFRTVIGRPMWPKNLHDYMTRTAARCGLEHLPPYSTRRGFITWAAPGVDRFALQKMAGHSSQDQTADYHQLDPAELARLRQARGEQPELRPVGQNVDRGPNRGPNLRNTVTSDDIRTDAGSTG